MECKCVCVCVCTCMHARVCVCIRGCLVEGKIAQSRPIFSSLRLLYKRHVDPPLCPPITGQQSKMRSRRSPHTQSDKNHLCRSVRLIKKSGNGKGGSPPSCPPISSFFTHAYTQMHQHVCRGNCMCFYDCGPYRNRTTHSTHTVLNDKHKFGGAHRQLPDPILPPSVRHL